jgi:SAM-dependent methyltransferase
MDQDRIRWDGRYANQPPPVPTAPDVIAEHATLFDILPTTGLALDIACGPGAQSLWLAERGLDVTALDVSQTAIDLLSAAASAMGLESSIHVSVHDTDAGLPEDLRDLSIIVCQRYRAWQLYGEFIDRLQVGGVLVLTVLSAVGLDGTPGEFHAPRGELFDAYTGTQTSTGDRVEVLHHQERDGQASIVVRRVS